MDKNDILGIYDNIMDDLKFYGISSVRMKIIISLMDGPKKTKQLRELTGIQSSTILHGISELEKQKIVLRDGDCYFLSEIGEILTPKLVELTKTLNVIRKFQNLWINHEINAIPENLLMEIGGLSDSQLIEADNADISKAYVSYADVLTKSKSIRGVSTIFHPHFIKTFVEILDNNEVEIELILSDAVLKKTIKSINPSNLKDFIKLNSSGNINLWVLNEEANIGFTVTDKYLSLGLYTKSGIYDSSRDLISENPDAIRWGNKLFEHYRKKADKIELRRLDKLVAHLI